MSDSIGDRFEQALSKAKFEPVYWLHPDDRITQGERAKIHWRELDGTLIRVEISRER